MLDKSTSNVGNTQHLIHRLPAGMMNGDKSTEIFACRETNGLFAISNGHTIPFSELEPELRGQILERLYEDPKALKDLKHLPLDKAVEQFAFCIFGAADSNPDFCESGNLREADNFICSSNCKCLHWLSKSITINGERLTTRQVEIIQLFATDKPDKQIADELGISLSTLDTHKKALFDKAGVSSKAGLITKAAAEKIIQ